MARVPTVVENGQRLQPLTRERFDPVNYADNGFAEGAERLGSTAGRVAAEQDQLDAALDNAGAKTLDNDFVGQAQGIRSGFLSQQGLNAGTARSATETALKELQTATIAKATTPRMRKMLEGVVNQRVTGMMGEFATHVTTQIQRADDDASSARIGLAADEAALTTDPIERQKNIGLGLSEIATRGQRMGWSADATKAESLKFASGVHKSILENMMTADDIDGAVAYRDSHVGQMTAGDVSRVNAMLHDPLERRETLNDAAMVFGEAPVAGSVGNDAPVATMGGMFTAIKAIETGGRHFAAPGKPMVSSKGAIGIAQIMPGTGPEAAKLAGETWSADRLAKDPDYNARLGSAYFNKQLQTFGNPVMAAAAYNAGPGRVQQAIARSKADGGSWIDHLPAETKGYVGKFQANIGTGVQQAPERHDLNQLLARVDVVADRQGWSPERRDRAKTEVQRRVGIDERLQDRVEDDARRDALSTIADLSDRKGGFTDLSQLPASVRANLSPQDRISFMSMAEQNAKALVTGATVKPNGPDAYNLNQLAIRDPEAFKRTQLGMYQNKLTPSELEGLGKLQAQMQTAGPGGVDHGKIWSAINRGAPDLGLDLGSSKGKANKPDDRATSMRIFSMVKSDLDARLHGANRQPTDDEVQQSYDRAVRMVAVNGDRDNPVHAYEVAGPAAGVPDLDRQQIQAAWQRRHGTMPTEGQIARAYQARR